MAQVRVVGEDNPVHVVDLPLHPVGTFPERVATRHGRVRVVHKRLHHQALAGRDVRQTVHDRVAVGRGRIVQVIDARQVRQHVEAAFFFETLQRREQGFHRDDDPEIVAELGGCDACQAASGLDFCEQFVVGHRAISRPTLWLRCGNRPARRSRRPAPDPGAAAAAYPARCGTETRSRRTFRSLSPGPEGP